LASLRNDLQKSLESFGIKQEKRPFKPHLTLGRFRKPVKDRALLEKIINEYSQIKGPEGKLQELVMFKSKLKPGGALYTKIHSWPLSEN
ncbi:2'-5' RNA ligase family protein, partial [Thermodesulfobacteriota bacterium]